ncbi:MAG TPA: hypothetical protein VF081_08095 [Solirubrobacterales bacterium]
MLSEAGRPLRPLIHDRGRHQFGGFTVIEALAVQPAPGPEVEAEAKQGALGLGGPSPGLEGVGQGLKGAHDPDDLFKGDHPIPPAAPTE